MLMRALYIVSGTGIIEATFIDRVPYFLYFTKESLESHTTNMATFVILRHPVTILVEVPANPDNLTNDSHSQSLTKVSCDTLLLCRELKQSDERIKKDFLVNIEDLQALNLSGFYQGYLVPNP